MPCVACNYWPVAGAIILPNVGGFLGGHLVKPNIGWYTNLKKPKWTPPVYSFCPIWSVIYSSIGYGSYLVYKHGGGFNGPARLPLCLYGGQLVLNWAWSPIFFHKRDLKAAFIENLALDAAVVATAIAFYKVNKNAGLIFVPYLLWLAIETVLCYRIYKDNPDGGATITEIKEDK